MKAVVMAGGEGTRLRPLTSNQPKPMVPIVGKPCMEHILELLRAHEMTERGDHAGRHRGLEPERIADGNDQLAAL